MKIYSIRKLVGAIALAGALTAQANSINGTIGINALGTLNPLGSTLGTAIGFTPSGVSTVNFADSSGDYLGTEGTVVNFSAFNWNPSSAPITPLWSFEFDSKTYSFDLNSVSVAPTSTSTFLNLVGTGVAHITGLEDTEGSWSFTTTGGGQKFQFVSYNSVPDGATTAMLLGSSLTVIGMVRRKRS